MNNTFLSRTSSDKTDETLVEEAVGGSRDALESLIRRHQNWIYNIALRMVMHPQDAEEVTQETLIKIVTHLSTFRRESRFRTWVYRITANHVLNMKKRPAELHYQSYDRYWETIDATPNLDFPDPDGVQVDVPVIVEEIKIHCMMGMLLCLDRQQRMIYILGQMLGIRDTIASGILAMSRQNFRQKLSRARKQLHNFMDHKCGLIRKDNPCHCIKKTRAMIEAGIVDPANLEFNKNYIKRIENVAPVMHRTLGSMLDQKCSELFRKQPFQEAPDFVEVLRDFLDSAEFRKILDLN